MDSNDQTAHDVKTKEKALRSAIIVVIIIVIGIVSVILRPTGGLFDGSRLGVQHIFWMIFLYITMAFFICHSIYNFLNYIKKTRHQYPGVVSIIFLALLIAPFVLSAVDSQYRYNQYQNNESPYNESQKWQTPTSSQLEKVSEAASILSERTGYEITFLEYEWVDIDEYELSEINTYIAKVLNDIHWLTIFIYTDDINTFDAKKCIDELPNRLNTAPWRYWNVYIYEKNVGEIKIRAVDDKCTLKMKASDSPPGTLRGDNYLDDKILILIHYDYSIYYGVLVNNIFNQ